MSRASSRLHTTGGVLFVLTGIAHSIGQFTASAPDPASAAIEQSMRRLVIPGTTFTYWNIFQCWGLLYGGMTVLFGILLLVSARAAKGDPAVRHASALVGVAAALLQTVVSIVFKATPPAFFMIPAAIILALAAGLPERRTP
jgi:hypothetical protein